MSDEELHALRTEMPFLRTTVASANAARIHVLAAERLRISRELSATEPWRPEHSKLAEQLVLVRDALSAEVSASTQKRA